MTLSQSDPAVTTTSSVVSGIPHYGRTLRALLRDPNISDRAKVIYALLDDYAGSESKPFPSRGTLAKSLGCSLDSVDRALAELAETGWITKQSRYRNDGGQTSTEYTLSAQGGAAVVRPPQPHGCGSKKENQVSTTSCPTEGRTSDEVAQSTEDKSKRKRTTTRVETPEFQTFYSNYPRHEARADAWKAWQQLMKDGVDPSCILTGLGQQDTYLHAKKDEGFCPLPASWLRGRRWDDEVTPRRNVQPERLRDESSLAYELRTGVKWVRQ